ncbi:unnamed protein product, partial [Brassica napus]
WNRDRVRQFIHEDDVEMVLQTKLSFSREDVMVWSFSANGSYNTRSPRDCLVLNNLRALLHTAGNYHITYVHHSLNRVASEIAASVTRDLRLQSYVASGGPCWLMALINLEAAANGLSSATD